MIGAESPAGFGFVVRHLFDKGLLTGTLHQTVDAQPGDADATLSFAGWEYLDKLRRGAVESRKAFMAMQFGNAELDQFVAEVLRPALEQTGFVLTRLDDDPRAGLIDDRLRVEIRAGRFLLADLSHGNRGAYWEAGFAEGLGKPVIYLCRRDVFEQDQTHFDTNHHLTVIWDPADPARAAEQLKATIRATLPDQARLED